MTVFERLKSLKTGWALTFRKLSAQMAAIDLLGIVPSLLMCADQIGPRGLIAVFAGLSLAKLVATNMAQENVGCYDKRTTGTFDLKTQKVVPIDA